MDLSRVEKVVRRERVLVDAGGSAKGRQAGNETMSGLTAMTKRADLGTWTFSAESLGKKVM